MEIQKPNPKFNLKSFLLNLKPVFLKAATSAANLILNLLRRIIGFFQKRLGLKKTIILFVSLIVVLI